MKLFNQYHNKFKCEGHSKENTVLRLFGLIAFLVIWSGMWTAVAPNAFIGIMLGILTTVFIDVVGGIGRRGMF